MPPRGSEGYDFSLLYTHYLFLVTFVLAFIGWWTALIGQAISQGQEGRVAHSTVGTLWFAIFLQLAIIMGVAHTIASDSIALHRFQVATFSAVAIVFAVEGVNQGIFTSVPSLEAMAAGWLLLAIVDILWVLYFTSEEGSLALHLFNSAGTGGLTGPGRNAFRPGGRRSVSRVNMANGGGGGYNGGIGPGDYSSPGMMGGGGYDTKEPGMGAMGAAPMSASQRSLGGGGGGSIGSGAAGGMSPRAGQAGLSAGAPGEPGSPHTPLMSSNNQNSLGSPSAAGDNASIPESYMYRAKALYAYTASPDDPNEISFTKGEILDIVDRNGKWWQARRADGTTGIAPSNYLQII